jgi:hypothetical protein
MRLSVQMSEPSVDDEYCCWQLAICLAVFDASKLDQKSNTDVTANQIFDVIYESVQVAKGTNYEHDCQE